MDSGQVKPARKHYIVLTLPIEYQLMWNIVVLVKILQISCFKIALQKQEISYFNKLKRIPDMLKRPESWKLCLNYLLSTN